MEFGLILAAIIGIIIGIIIGSTLKQPKINELQTKIDRLEKAFEQRRADAQKRIRAQQAEIDDLREKSEQYRNSFELEKQKRTDADKKIKARQIEINNLRKKSEQYRNSFELEKQKLKAQQDKISDLEKDISKLPVRMSYIHCDDNNYYGPSENLQSLFEELAIRPYEHISIPFDDKLSFISKVLDHGRTDFDEPILVDGYSYSPEDKVTLYCFNYMPLHLYSSHHLYSKPLIPWIEYKNILFIDFGCGPLTSGIAFWAATRQSNITYIGIDTSQTMLNKAREINQYGANNSGEPFYKNIHLVRHYDKLPELLNSIEIGNPDETLTIFNFCYFFQSKMLSIKKLAKVLNSVCKNNTCMVYQDPVWDKFQEKWHHFKSEFSHPGFKWQGPTKVMDVKCKNLKTHPRPKHELEVSYDNFNNFS